MGAQELILDGLRSSFLDASFKSNGDYKSEFVSNNLKESKKVLSYIEEELQRCTSFKISVAFITMSGIVPLLQTLKELESRNIKGKILTTNYLNFSEPEALKKLASLTNLEVKMYITDSNGEGFHTKGYIFENKELYRFIVGSSNMTQKALAVNHEWNTKIISTPDGEYTKKILSEFEELWNSENTLNYDDFIEKYETNYRIIKQQQKVASSETVPILEDYKLKPNSMQVSFIQSLNKICDEGEKRALLISATGTGKTYASAFALRDRKAKRILFLVHREQIAKQAMKSYKRIFGSKKSYGLISGNSKEYGKDITFCTMQMMAKNEVRSQFQKDEFDTIVIDEAHRIGAQSYQAIMDYFEPQLMLGMTASPDRTDNFDVYKAFNHQIAYEIRLQQALEENLLCPFHYFGITDFEGIDSKTSLRDFNRLVIDKRVDYIIEQIKYYGYSGEHVNGLVFCSSKNEAVALSQKFNNRGFKTIALTGEDSQEKREEAIEQLVNNNRPDKLDYIFTVDIFNEGVDIPEINQVVMLRPTQSPIVFVQQLGRGLRKASGKEFVVILDFIGNYDNNFMIPIALSGDRTYNKDNLRKYVMEGERTIPGASTIHFDAVSRNQIFKSIDSANFSDIQLIKENYKNLKYKLGRIPKLIDFDKYGEMDVLRIFDNNSLGSYYMFLKKYEKDYTIELSLEMEEIIEFVSKKLVSGKRPHELIMLELLLNNTSNLIKDFKIAMKRKYGKTVSKLEIVSSLNVLLNTFPTAVAQKRYKDCIFVEKNDDSFTISKKFKGLLRNKHFLIIIKELINYGLYRNNLNYKDTYEDTNLVLYKKYTYEDVCRLLNWERNEVPLNIGGYKYDKYSKTYPIFINYDKKEDISDTIKYEDHFVSNNKLVAISKSNRTLSSDDVVNMLQATERGIEVHLFVRKNKDDNTSKEFYYLGKMQALGTAKEFTMANTSSSAVEIEWILNNTVRDDIYRYIIGG